MNIIDFVKPELLILIPVLYFIGVAFKKSKSKDKYIPFILGAIGIVLAVIWVMATSSIVTTQDVFMAIFVAITQGVLCAGLTVYFNQLFKQAKKEE